ncbi:hypothetical protein Hdeb2414_s0025g00659911 [Helianthus debilis subsp. tardiflorus]
MVYIRVFLNPYSGRGGARGRWWLVSVRKGVTTERKEWSRNSRSCIKKEKQGTSMVPVAAAGFPRHPLAVRLLQMRPHWRRQQLSFFPF